MSCCSSRGELKNNNKKVSDLNEQPKSFLGKYLHTTGKKEAEKEKCGSKHKGDCC